MANGFSRRHAGICIAAIAGILYLSAGQSPLFAKGGKKNNNNGQQQAPTSQPQNPQVMAAAQKVQDAQRALAAATAAFKKKYEATPEWSAAADAQKSAQKALAKEHAAVLDKLAGTDDYKAAITKKEQASADLQAANADPGNADPGHTADLANAVMQATQDKSKLETDALQNDAGYAQAQFKLQAANATMSDLQSQEKAAMQQDPDWQQAHQTLVDAQAAYEKMLG